MGVAILLPVSQSDGNYLLPQHFSRTYFEKANLTSPYHLILFALLLRAPVLHQLILDRVFQVRLSASDSYQPNKQCQNSCLQFVPTMPLFLGSDQGCGDILLSYRMRL